MQFGEAFISLIPQLDHSAVGRTQAEAGIAGRKAGDSFGDGFSRGADGKLRDTNGRFVRGAGTAGSAGGLQFNSAFGKWVDKTFTDLDKRMSNFGKNNKELGTFGQTLATMGARATVAGAGIAAMIPSVLSLTNALIPAAGALVAYPGLLGAVKVATAVTKLAVLGFGDAVQDAFTGTAEEAQVAIAKLPPQAQIAARSLLGFKTELEELRTSTSDSFFAPINQELGDLGNKYLPAVQKQFPLISGAVGDTAAQLMDAATNGKLFDGVNSLLGNTAKAIDLANNNTGAFADALGSAVEVSSKNLPTIAKGFNDAVGSVSAFISKAAETGKLQEWFNAAMNTIRTLGQLITNVGSIIFSVLKAAQSDGANLLDVLVSLTDQIAKFLRTGEGMNALKATFQTFSDIGDGLRTGLAAVLPAIAQSAGIAGPVIGRLAHVAGDLLAAVAPLLPYFTQLSSTILTALIPVIAALAKFLAENETVMKVLATAIGVVVTATKLYAVYTKAAVLATTIWTVATKAAAIASNAWAVATYLVNAAMRANPIGIVITAIVALVAIIVLAYKHNETFREIVQKVWAAIKVAISAVADWFTKTVWPALKTAISAIGDFFGWLWKNAIVPAWNGIKVAIEVAWGVIKVLFAAGEIYIRALATVFTWLWKNIIEPVWNGIKLAISIAIKAIEISFKSIQLLIQLVGAAFSWLWQNVIVPVWNGIKTAIQAAWNFIRDNIFNPLIKFVTVTLKGAWEFYRDIVQSVWNKVKEILGAAWSWVKENVLQPIINFINGPLKRGWETYKEIIKVVWQSFKDIIKAGWDWVKQHVFDPIVTFITKTIPDAFRKGVDSVKSAWDKIKEIVRTPIVAVVKIINNGVIAGFNKVSGFVNGPHIDPISLGFASGGVLPGYTPGRDVHKFIGPAGSLELSGGEAIMRPEFTRAVGPAFIKAANAAARAKGVSGVRGYISSMSNSKEHRHFKDGGIFGGITDAIGKAWDTFTDPVSAFKSGVTAMLGSIGGGQFGSVLKNVVTKLIDSVGEWISSKFSSITALTGGPVAGGGSQANLVNFGRWLQSQGYQVSEHPAFGGVTPGAHVAGSKHYVGRAIDVNHGAGTSATEQRYLAAIIGKAHALGLHSIFMSAGHYNHAHFDYAQGGVFKYDNGGWFRPGQVGVNQLKKPEAVLTPEESQGLRNMGVGEFADLLRDLIEEVRANGHTVGGYIRGSGRAMVARARQA